MSPVEELTDWGVPVDASIVEYINRINDLPKIRPTYSCSGMNKDHTGEFGGPYIVISTGHYVGTDLEPARRYPHETHKTSLKTLRAVINAGWYGAFNTTNHNGINGMSAIYASTQPSIPKYTKLLLGNVTGKPTKTRDARQRAREDIREEIRDNFVENPSDKVIEDMWADLVFELEWELKERRNQEPL